MLLEDTASPDEKIVMTRNQLYGVRTTEEDIKMEPVYETPEEKMEMTQNQLYGVRSTGDNITMEANVVYEVPKDKPPLEEVKMTQNQLYGVRSTGDNITMEANVVYNIGATDTDADDSSPRAHDVYDYIQA